MSTEITGGKLMYAADLLITSGSGAKGHCRGEALRVAQHPDIIGHGWHPKCGRRSPRFGRSEAIFAVAIQILESVKDEASKRYPAISIYDVNALRLCSEST
ncbi:hypothetical protein ACVWXL_008862 [Bradyrhizobium sp. GM22.5]